MPELAHHNRRHVWRPALVHAVLPLSIVLGLMTYWYGIADRYLVFLYYHNHTGIPGDVTPFGPATLSRYRMSGLVACGAVLLLYTALAWARKRLAKDYQPPAWWRVWCISAIVLVLGIPTITMSLGHPRMPLGVSFQILVYTLVGLAGALQPAGLFATEPWRGVGLALDGLGPMLLLLSIDRLDMLAQWSRSGRSEFIVMFAFLIALGCLWLLIMWLLQRKLHWSTPSASRLLLAGILWAYLLLPVFHWTLFTDGYYYITDSANFLADSLWLQAGTWLIVGALVAGATTLRKKWNGRAQAI